MPHPDPPDDGSWRASGRWVLRGVLGTAGCGVLLAVLLVVAEGLDLGDTGFAVLLGAAGGLLVLATVVAAVLASRDDARAYERPDNDHLSLFRRGREGGPPPA